MDVWQIIELINSNNLSKLEGVFQKGISPNLTCEYTGMTALLLACENNKMNAGANTNCVHYDGYNCYDVTTNKEIKCLLLKNGFDLVLPKTAASKYAIEYRFMSPVTVINETCTYELPESGKNFELEYKLYQFPLRKGDINTTFEPDIKQINLSGVSEIHKVERVKFKYPTKLRMELQQKTRQ